MNSKSKNYLIMHLVIFIWGFTAIFGLLISIDTIALVWYRMLIACLCLLVFVSFGLKNKLRVSFNILKKYVFAGILLTLHWLCFFKAIKISNVSITLVTLSTGAFFTAIIEPIWSKRRVIWHELIFGVIVVIGLSVIYTFENAYTSGILVALLASILAVLFSIYNSKLVKKYSAVQIGFYELLTGTLILTVVLAFNGSLGQQLFIINPREWLFIILLASFCTAYAYVASIEVMKKISPFTIMLSVNLEPIYGILLAYLIFGESEVMNLQFYIGAFIILFAVILNGIIKLKYYK